MLTTVVTSLLGAVYWASATHLYTPHQVGTASALIAMLILASNLSSIGLGAALVQRLPQCATDRGWSAAITAALIVGAGSGLLAAMLCLLVLRSLWWQPAVLHGHQIVLLFTLGVPLWTLAGIVDAIFIAQRAAGWMLVRNIACSGLKIPLVTIPAATGHGSVQSLLFAWIAASGITACGAIVCLFPRLQRSYRPTLHRFGAEVRSLLRSFAGHHCIGLGGMAWMYLLPVLVSARLSATENAYSSVTWMTGGFFFMVSGAVSLALFAEGTHATRSLTVTVGSASRIIAGLLIPALLICVLAGGRILALFGPGYARQGTALLLLLGLAAVPDAITNLAVMVWRVQRRLAAAALLNLGMATLSLALAWLWMPRFGILGTGWAWLLGQSAGATIVLGMLLKPRSRTRKQRTLP
ncbi:MAG TPA: sugar transporter [Chloroflexota bacterium]|nr:sugar transporter [Chloroflexota bacterium]